MGSVAKRLTMAVNGVYFDQIRSGEKTEEYRLDKPFWRDRLRREYAEIVLTRGYPKGGGIEGETRLTFPWRGTIEREIQHPHFGDEPVRVFAIQLKDQPA